MRQDWLIPYENPLCRRLGADLFADAPRTPGVYAMLGAGDAVLYVGKAKNLRARLLSYRRARPGDVSRKVIRMLNAVAGVRWEECPTETAALLRENQLLRELRPPFNVANTRPDTYYFVAVRLLGGGPAGHQLRLRLAMNPKRQGDLVFGAYKGRSRVRAAHSALLRLIWATGHGGARFEFPARLTGARVPDLYTVDFRPGWFPALKRFFNGTDTSFLRALTEALLDKEDLPAFIHRRLQEDIETALEFFELCPKRNLRLKRAAGLRGRLIPQALIDDLLVLEKARRGEIGS